MQIAVNCIVSFAFSCDVKRRQSVSARNQTVIQREARAALRMKASKQDVRAASWRTDARLASAEVPSRRDTSFGLRPYPSPQPAIAAWPLDQ